MAQPGNWWNLFCLSDESLYIETWFHHYHKYYSFLHVLKNHWYKHRMIILDELLPLSVAPYHSFRILGHGPQYFQMRVFEEQQQNEHYVFFKNTTAVSIFCFYQLQKTVFVLIFLNCVMIVPSPHAVPTSVPGVLLGGGEIATLDSCDWHWLEREADIMFLLPKVLSFSLLVRRNSMTPCLVLQRRVTAVWLKTRRFQCEMLWTHEAFVQKIW